MSLFGLFRSNNQFFFLRLKAEGRDSETNKKEDIPVLKKGHSNNKKSNTVDCVSQKQSSHALFKLLFHVQARLILQEGCYVSLYNHDEGYGQRCHLQGGWLPVGSAEHNEELELET